MSQKPYQRKWYLENQERLRAKARQRYKEKRAEILQYQKGYHLKNRQRDLRRSREHYRNNRAVYIQRSRNFYAAHREDILVLGKARRSAKVTRIKLTPEQRKINRKRNADRWVKKNPRKIYGYVVARRARKRGAEIGPQNVISKWTDKIKAKPFARCYWCGKLVSTRKIQIDHIHALNLGGRHSADNLCVSCPSCNGKKSDRAIRDWNAKLEQPILL